MNVTKSAKDSDCNAARGASVNNHLHCSG